MLMNEWGFIGQDTLVTLGKSATSFKFKSRRGIDKDLETMALGTREKDYPVQAINILTQLKKMDKEGRV